VALIDERGRLVGRWNVIDVAVVMLAGVMFVLVAIGYALFRLPNPPVITSVQPASVAAHVESRIQIKGRNFLPYLRVYLGRTGSADFVKRPGETEAQDAFTIVNGTQVEFLIETPTLAEVKLPPLGPGSYDIHFYDEVKHLAVQEAAFVVVSQQASGGGFATLIVKGAFAGLQAADAATLHAGAPIVGDEIGWGEVLSVDTPEPDVAQILIRDRVIPATVVGRVQVPATVRVRCSVVRNECRVGATAVAPGNLLPATVGGRATTFRISDVEADTARPAK
jgi:hypothetical protein